MIKQSRKFSCQLNSCKIFGCVFALFYSDSCHIYSIWWLWRFEWTACAKYFKNLKNTSKNAKAICYCQETFIAHTCGRGKLMSVWEVVLVKRCLLANYDDRYVTVTNEWCCFCVRNSKPFAKALIENNTWLISVKRYLSVEWFSVKCWAT